MTYNFNYNFQKNIVFFLKKSQLHLWIRRVRGATLTVQGFFLIFLFTTIAARFLVTFPRKNIFDESSRVRGRGEVPLGGLFIFIFPDFS